MEITDRRTAYDGYLKIQKLTLSDGKKTFERELLERGDAVAALVYDTRKKVFVFVRQFRPGSGSDLVEVVAGMLDKDGEKPEATIRREIGEEMGYAVDHLEPIRTFYSSPGGTSEQIHLFYAEVSRQESAGGGVADENESIELVEIPEENLNDFPLADAKSLVGVYWWLYHRRQRKDGGGEEISPGAE